MSTSPWTFEIDHVDARRLRLDILNVACRLHDSGMQDDGDTVRDTATKLLAFVNGEEASLTA
jgi:hypothetical protein